MRNHFKHFLLNISLLTPGQFMVRVPGDYDGGFLVHERPSFLS